MIKPEEIRAGNLISTAATVLINAIRTGAYPNLEAFLAGFATALAARLELVGRRAGAKGSRLVVGDAKADRMPMTRQTHIIQPIPQLPVSRRGIEALVAVGDRLSDALRLARAHGRLLADRDRRLDAVLVLALRPLPGAGPVHLRLSHRLHRRPVRLSRRRLCYCSYGPRYRRRR